MVRRLPVVVSQSPTSDPARRAFEEAFVAALLIERGMDVSVVPHVERLEPGGTGLVCIEGIVGPFVIAAWMEPEATVTCLNARGVSGRRGGMSWDVPEKGVSRAEPAASVRPASGRLAESAARSIYAIDMRRGADIDSVLHELRRIQADSAIVTVALRGLGSNGDPKGQASARVTDKPTRSPARNAIRDERETVDRTLDRLVDELDRMDL